jgi:hypothetical protein
MYNVRRISNKEELSGCDIFKAEHFMWNSTRRPEAFGRMGYLERQGLYVRMTCLESGPKREYKNHMENVYKDSAMEIFLAFPDADLKQSDPPARDSLYFNFEINANGAMYAKYGHGRQGRQFITDEEYAATGVNAVIEPDSWSVELLIPESLLKRVGGIRHFSAGSIFFFNFYKISEDPAIEHYGAYSPMPGDKPDFHQPPHFARAVIV